MLTIRVYALHKASRQLNTEGNIAMNDDIFNDPKWVESALNEWCAKQEIAERRRGHSIVEDLKSVLWPHGERGLDISEVLKRLKRLRTEEGLPIPDKFDAGVRSAYNQHCIGYAAFEKRGLPPSKAPFYSPRGKGSGIWAINPRYEGWQMGKELGL